MSTCRTHLPSDVSVLQRMMFLIFFFPWRIWLNAGFIFTVCFSFWYLIKCRVVPPSLFQLYAKLSLHGVGNSDSIEMFVCVCVCVLYEGLTFVVKILIRIVKIHICNFTHPYQSVSLIESCVRKSLRNRMKTWNRREILWFNTILTILALSCLCLSFVTCCFMFKIWDLIVLFYFFRFQTLSCLCTL